MPFFGPWPATVVDELHVHQAPELVEALPERSPEPLEHRRMLDLVLDEKTRRRIEGAVIAERAREVEHRERLGRLFKRPAGSR